MDLKAKGAHVDTVDVGNTVSLNIMYQMFGYLVIRVFTFLARRCARSMGQFS